MNRHENKSSTPSQILPYLYQGKAPKLEDYAALASMGIMSVINCTNHINNHFEDMGMVYLRVPLEDSGDSNILEYFDECNRFIEKQKELGSVLVHCAGGICRSSTIVVAYLIASKKLSLKLVYLLSLDLLLILSTKRCIG